jgi:hypothetical protein
VEAGLNMLGLLLLSENESIGFLSNGRVSPQGVTSKNTAIFKISAVKASNLAHQKLLN